MLNINRASGTKRRRQGGTAVVEFALVLPILLLLLFGIVEMSLLQYDLLVIANASREAARSGIKKTYEAGAPTWPTIGAIQKIGEDYIKAGGLYSVGGDGPTITVALSTDSGKTFIKKETLNEKGCRAPASSTDPQPQLRVTVSFTYSFLTLAKLMGWSNTKGLNAPTVMICE